MRVNYLIFEAFPSFPSHERYRRAVMALVVIFARVLFEGRSLVLSATFTPNRLTNGRACHVCKKPSDVPSFFLGHGERVIPISVLLSIPIH